MGAEIAVAEREPGRVAVRRRLLQHPPGLVGPAPAAGLVVAAAQGVHHGVQVGADPQAVQGDVVPGVADDRDVGVREGGAGALDEPGAPHAAGQDHDLHGVSLVIRPPAHQGHDCRPHSARLVAPAPGIVLSALAWRDGELCWPCASRPRSWPCSSWLCGSSPPSWARWPTPGSGPRASRLGRRVQLSDDRPGAGHRLVLLVASCILVHPVRPARALALAGAVVVGLVGPGCRSPWPCSVPAGAARRSAWTRWTPSCSWRFRCWASWLCVRLVGWPRPAQPRSAGRARRDLRRRHEQTRLEPRPTRRSNPPGSSMSPPAPPGTPPARPLPGRRPRGGARRARARTGLPGPADTQRAAARPVPDLDETREDRPSTSAETYAQTPLGSTRRRPDAWNGPASRRD